jgi:3-deoxy-manno-octulosonate cytidylyltransferase (CMP-KDO synthetase)
MSLMKTVIGVIPARYASTRFPGKPLAPIRGKPMIQWVPEGARQSKLLSKVIVATDDERIARAVRAIGGEVAMTASELPTGTDRINAAVRDLKADIVVNIQGDEPLIQAAMLDELVAPLWADASLEMSTMSNEITTEELANLNSVKVVTDQNGNALYFSRFPIPYSRASLTRPAACAKHLGLYAYQRQFLERFCAAPPSPLEQAESLEQLRALEMGARIRVVKTRYRSLGVDTPEDLAKIEQSLGGAK